MNPISNNPIDLDININKIIPKKPNKDIKLPSQALVRQELLEKPTSFNENIADLLMGSLNHSKSPKEQAAKSVTAPFILLGKQGQSIINLLPKLLKNIQ